MKTVANSDFSAYDVLRPQFLDETTLSRHFREAISHGKSYLGVRLEDGDVIVLDVKKDKLSDALKEKNSSMYGKGCMSGAVSWHIGNSRETVLRALS